MEQYEGRETFVMEWPLDWKAFLSLVGWILDVITIEESSAEIALLSSVAVVFERRSTIVSVNGNGC